LLASVNIVYLKMSTEFDVGDQTSEMELDPATMKVADLKRELKLRGIAVTGKKEELIERLQLAVMRGEDTSMNEGAGDEDDDLLAQANALLEDDPISSAEKKILNREGNQTKKKVAIKRDTALQAVSETKASTALENIEMSTKKEGKATSKRTQISIDPENEQNTVNTPGSNGSTSDAKDSKENGTKEDGKTSLSSKSDAEKAKTRAERFGVVASTNLDEKKTARAARFGGSTTSNKIGESPSVDLDTLKRRAERFGQSTSTTMQKLELQQKIKDREGRFGKVETSTAESKRARITSPNQDLLTDEKMKKRSERFGVKA